MRKALSVVLIIGLIVVAVWRISSTPTFPVDRASGKPLAESTIDRIIVCRYSERADELGSRIQQFLTTTTGQEYYKVRRPSEKKPPPGIVGEYVNIDDEKNVQYEIVLSEDGTATYEVSKMEDRFGPDSEGINLIIESVKMDTKLLRGTWRIKEKQIIEIRVRHIN